MPERAKAAGSRRARGPSTVCPNSGFSERPIPVSIPGHNTLQVFRNGFCLFLLSVLISESVPTKVCTNFVLKHNPWVRGSSPHLSSLGQLLLSVTHTAVGNDLSVHSQPPRLCPRSGVHKLEKNGQRGHGIWDTNGRWCFPDASTVRLIPSLRGVVHGCALRAWLAAEASRDAHLGRWLNSLRNKLAELMIKHLKKIGINRLNHSRAFAVGNSSY